ncbi:MAG: hypothetical protein ACRDZ5_11910, partial [Acidimicrobiales bacterium]
LPSSVVSRQVRNGVVTRMAVLFYLLGAEPREVATGAEPREVATGAEPREVADAHEAPSHG